MILVGNNYKVIEYFLILKPCAIGIKVVCLDSYQVGALDAESHG